MLFSKFSKSANCECAKPGLEYSNFKILGSKFVSMVHSHTSSVTSWIQSWIFVSTSSNTLEHNKTLINLASLRCFSILHRSRESQWILLRTKIRNNKTKNPLRQRVKRMCWMRVRWSVFPLSNAVFVKNSVTGGGDGNTSPGRFSQFHASEANYRMSVVLLKLAAIKANRWYFTYTIFYGNKLPGDFRGKHRIVLCNINLNQHDLLIHHYHLRSSYSALFWNKFFAGRIFPC